MKKSGARAIKRPQKFIDGEIGGELAAADRNAVSVVVKFKDEEGADMHVTKEVSLVDDLKYPDNRPVRHLEDLKLGEEVLSLYHGNVMWEAVVVRTSDGSESKKESCKKICRKAEQTDQKTKKKKGSKEKTDSGTEAAPRKLEITQSSERKTENTSQKKKKKILTKQGDAENKKKENSGPEKLKNKKKELKAEENANKAAAFAARQALAAQLFSNKIPNNDIPSNISNDLGETSDPGANPGSVANCGANASPSSGAKSGPVNNPDPDVITGHGANPDPHANTNPNANSGSGAKSGPVNNPVPCANPDPDVITGHDANPDPHANTNPNANPGSSVKFGLGANPDPGTSPVPCANTGTYPDPNVNPVPCANAGAYPDPIANPDQVVCPGANPDAGAKSGPFANPVPGSVAYPAVTGLMPFNSNMYGGQSQPNQPSFNFGLNPINFGFPQQMYPLRMPFFNPNLNFPSNMSYSSIGQPPTENGMQHQTFQPILHDEPIYNSPTSTELLDNPSSQTEPSSDGESTLVTQSLNLINDSSSPQNMVMHEQESNTASTDTPVSIPFNDTLHDGMRHTYVSNCSPDRSSMETHEPKSNCNMAGCPGCLAKDLLIKDLKHQIKVLKGARDGNSPGPSESSRKRQYIPKTRPDITFAPYMLLENPKNPKVPDGYQQLAANAPIAVPVDWLKDTLATISKTTDRRKKKKAKKTGQFKTHDSSKETIRKLMDGFYDATELAIPGGTKRFTSDPIFKSLKLYAVHVLNMTEPSFNECWNKKMTYYRCRLSSSVKHDLDSSVCEAEDDD